MFEIKFMSRKEVDREDEEKALKRINDSYVNKLIQGGVFMGFKFETLRAIQKAAAENGKEANKYVLELIGGQNEEY